MIVTLLIAVFVISVASTWWFGLWSNLITLVNLLLSAMVASSFFINTSFELQVRLESFTLLLPFVSLWILFIVTFIVLRGLTDTLSNMRLKFDNITEMVGRSLLSLAVAWVLVCFVNFSLHLAPVKETWFSGNESFDRTFDSMKPKDFGAVAYGPDLAWAHFVASRSDGSLSYPKESSLFFPELKPYAGEPANSSNRVFPVAMMLNSGVAVRKAVSGQNTLRVTSEALDAIRKRETEKVSSPSADPGAATPESTPDQPSDDTSDENASDSTEPN